MYEAKAKGRNRVESGLTVHSSQPY
jgi:hypothetical protein